MIKKQKNIKSFLFNVEFEHEEDGRWIAEIPKLPGAMAYGKTKQEASRRAYTIALRIMADSIEQGRALTFVSRLFGHEMAHR